MKNYLTILTLALASLSGAQTIAIPSTAPTPPPLQGHLTWDFAVNKPFVLATYNDGMALTLGNLSLSPITFTGTYLGSSGVGLGEGGQASLNLTGKLFGFSLVGSSLTAAIGEALFTGEKPHAIMYLGGAISSGLLARLVK